MVEQLSIRAVCLQVLYLVNIGTQAMAHTVSGTKITLAIIRYPLLGIPGHPEHLHKGTKTVARFEKVSFPTKPKVSVVNHVLELMRPDSSLSATRACVTNDQLENNDFYNSIWPSSYQKLRAPCMLSIENHMFQYEGSVEERRYRTQYVKLFQV
jgi:hypothetical protein